ncbi:MAG TPA: sodium:solute symporter, partial [Saprospiraceae bacterium]|nr:sodium:solute symporter [Saprospiraceae bacterium]
MHPLDWLILCGTLIGIVVYGIWKTRHISSSESYLLGDRDLPWWTIGLSIMATQASAITFLSTPGQAYEDGMRFAQFYFGLPLAMVILSVFVLPIYYKLKVYTAYEYLESRFDLKTRTFTAILFLIQRGLAAGLTIYAPAIILSAILDWNLNLTILIIGLLVIAYTVLGGTKAVSQTQKQQMLVILIGMVVAFVVLLNQMPEGVGFGDALGVAGKMGKLNVVDFEFDLSNRYNMWSALLGGTFLFLSYFGTDQSQVSRYLSGKSLTESRLGLLFNGIFKVPMQFFILLVGIMVFMFFQFEKPPIHFNKANITALENSQYKKELDTYQLQFDKIHTQKKTAINELIIALRDDDQRAVDAAQATVDVLHMEDKKIRDQLRKLIEKNDSDADTEDSDYVFINFVTKHLPIGVIGLLLAVIFSAAMSSTASELNALASTSMVDIYKRSLLKDKSDAYYLKASKIMTLVWGGIALSFAMTAHLFDNLIEAVNIVGSIFYGTILGVFIVGFFLQWIKG